MPSDFDEREAEAQELMVHVHFDAKYRIESIEQIFGKDDAELDEAGRERDLNSEKQEQREGRYKRADLLKMHAYHDAIRRTHGAYVLYPGDKAKQWEGYREILPGIGAFPIRPGNGAQEVEKFVREIVAHTCDRATARERQSYHSYRAQEAPAAYSVLRAYPERGGASASRHTPPAETFVLVGWNKSEEHLKWILREKLYNFRMDTRAGSLRLEPEIAAAQYLLLHGEGAKAESGLLRITSKGPRVLSKDALKRKGYPGEPGGDFYLVFDVEQAAEFDSFSWGQVAQPARREAIRRAICRCAGCGIGGCAQLIRYGRHLEQAKEVGGDVPDPLARKQGNRIAPNRDLPRVWLTGWRRNQPLLGKPDFTFRRERVAVFVDGCFWHGCPKCYRRPSSNRKYWDAKIDANRKRDRYVSRELRKLGWKVVRIWQHQLANPARVAGRVIRALEPA